MNSMVFECVVFFSLICKMIKYFVIFIRLVTKQVHSYKGIIKKT
jgi:hypothetical protein